jgi:hypothetical protein
LDSSPSPNDKLVEAILLFSPSVCENLKSSFGLNITLLHGFKDNDIQEKIFLQEEEDGKLKIHIENKKMVVNNYEGVLPFVFG